MDRELAFAKGLEEIKRLAKEQGSVIGKDQIAEILESLALGEAEMELVYEYLKSNKIGVDEAINPDAYLSGEEKNYLEFYYEELAMLPDFSEGEKRAWTIAALAGESDAREKIVEMYLKEVVEVAKLYTGQGVLLEDLIGEGNMALTIGSTMLDSQEKPEECEGFLMRMVMDAMEELIKENSDLEEVDKKALARANKILDKANALSEELGKKVTVEELATEEHLSRKEIMDALRITGFSIDAIEFDQDNAVAEE